jgi:hypothetical protein
MINVVVPTTQVKPGGRRDSAGDITTINSKESKTSAVILRNSRSSQKGSAQVTRKSRVEGPGVALRK